MIDYPQFSFAAPPCVYSHWFVFVAGSAGLRPARHFPTQLVPPLPNHGKFVVSIVRHPLTWLHSYFENMKGKETRIPEVDVFRDCYQGSQNRFPIFVDAYLKKCPGAVSRLYQAYHSSNVMRVEDFPNAAADFLESFGHVTDCRRFAFGDSCGWMHDRDIRRAVVNAEFDFCCDYEYY